ncbi:hypothetical protein NDU88_005579 [Pleurodeles waltl]|uniref:Uncharacterized protein n=1 Tax=Pleurodeles waltl TaxID=8319 RepID=A0AAV7PFT5_PLEWA|nr:hypothetical protein NDU88_005579 [Pleurodeles waltl]
MPTPILVSLQSQRASVLSLLGAQESTAPAAPTAPRLVHRALLPPGKMPVPAPQWCSKRHGSCSSFWPPGRSQPATTPTVCRETGENDPRTTAESVRRRKFITVHIRRILERMIGDEGMEGAELHYAVAILVGIKPRPPIPTKMSGRVF